jgi:hypothetical protein
MSNIVYLSDYPSSISFGGKEIQMFQYFDFINNNYKNEFNIKLLDFWSLEALQDVDILHLFGHSYWYSTIIPIIKSKFPKIKIVISPTFYKSNELFYTLLSYFSRKFPIPNYFSIIYNVLFFSDIIIINSNAELVQLKRLFPINNNKFQVIYNAIESHFNQFENKNNLNLFLEQFNIEPGYFLSVSFFERRKNTLNLIKAFLNTYHKTKRKLVLIGKNRFDDKIEFTEIDNLIKNNPDKILHVDYLERNSDILKSAYFHSFAHLMPSIIETPGISNLEAAIFGKNLLVGKSKPVEEYFKNYPIYPKSKNFSDIANSILKINSEDPINKELQEFILSNYTIDISISKLVKVYRNLLE